MVCLTDLWISELQKTWAFIASFLHWEESKIENYFIGTSIEQTKLFNEMNHTNFNDFLMKLGGKWITCNRNLTTANNIDGGLESKICSDWNICKL